MDFSFWQTASWLQHAPPPPPFLLLTLSFPSSLSASLSLLRHHHQLIVLLRGSRQSERDDVVIVVFCPYPPPPFLLLPLSFSLLLGRSRLLPFCIIIISWLLGRRVRRSERELRRAPPTSTIFPNSSHRQRSLIPLPTPLTLTAIALPSLQSPSRSPTACGWLLCFFLIWVSSS